MLSFGECDTRAVSSHSNLATIVALHDPFLIDAKASVKVGGMRKICLDDDQGHHHVLNMSPLIRGQGQVEYLQRPEGVWFHHGDIHGLVWVSSKNYDAPALVAQVQTIWDVKTSYTLMKQGRVIVLTNRWTNQDEKNDTINVQSEKDDLVIKHISGPTDGDSWSQSSNITISRHGGLAVSGNVNSSLDPLFQLVAKMKSDEETKKNAVMVKADEPKENQKEAATVKMDIEEEGNKDVPVLPDLKALKTDAQRHTALTEFLERKEVLHVIAPQIWASLVKTFEKEGSPDPSCTSGRTPAAFQIVRRIAPVTPEWVEAFIAAGAFRYRVSEQAFRDRYGRFNTAATASSHLSDDILCCSTLAVNPVVLKDPSGEPYEVEFNCKSSTVCLVSDASKLAQFGAGVWFQASEIKGFLWMDPKYVVPEQDLLDHFKLSFSDGRLFRCNGMSAICTHGGSCGRSDIKIRAGDTDQQLVIHARRLPSPTGNHCRMWALSDLRSCPASVLPSSPSSSSPVPPSTAPLSDSILLERAGVKAKNMNMTLKDPKGDAYHVDFTSKSQVQVVLDAPRKEFGSGAWFQCDDIKGFVWMDGQNRVADHDVSKHFQLSFAGGMLYRCAGMSAICTHAGAAGAASLLLAGGSGVGDSDICIMKDLEFRHLVIHPRRLPPTETGSKDFKCVSLQPGVRSPARSVPVTPPSVAAKTTPPPPPPAKTMPAPPPPPPAYKFRDLFLEPGIERKLYKCSGKKGLELKDDQGKLHVFDIVPLHVFDIVPLKEENPPRALLELVSENQVLWFRRGGLRGMILMTTKDYDGEEFVKNHVELAWNAQKDGYSLLKSGRMLILTNRWGQNSDGVIHLQGDHDDLLVRHMSGPSDGNASIQMHGIRSHGPIGGSVVSFGGGAHVHISGVTISDGDFDGSAVAGGNASVHVGGIIGSSGPVIITAAAPGATVRHNVHNSAIDWTGVDDASRAAIEALLNP